MSRIINLNPTVLSGNSNGGGSSSGESVVLSYTVGPHSYNQFTTIQEAIDYAKLNETITSVNPIVIKVETGSYNPFTIDVDYISVIGSGVGLTSINNTEDNIIIDEGYTHLLSDMSIRCDVISTENTSFKMSNCKMINNNTNIHSTSQCELSYVYYDESNINASGSTVLNLNHVSGEDWDLYLNGDDTRLQVNDSVLEDLIVQAHSDNNNGIYINIYNSTVDDDVQIGLDNENFNSNIYFNSSNTLYDGGFYCLGGNYNLKSCIFDSSFSYTKVNPDPNQSLNVSNSRFDQNIDLNDTANEDEVKITFSNCEIHDVSIGGYTRVSLISCYQPYDSEVTIQKTVTSIVETIINGGRFSGQIVNYANAQSNPDSVLKITNAMFDSLALEPNSRVIVKGCMFNTSQIKSLGYLILINNTISSDIEFITPNGGGTVLLKNNFFESAEPAIRSPEPVDEGTNFVISCQDNHGINLTELYTSASLSLSTLPYN